MDNILNNSGDFANCESQSKETSRWVEAGALYVVATPIGNLSDITNRAKQVLEEVNFIAAEDTRVSGKLLSVFGIRQSIVNYFEHNKKEMGEKIIARLINGESCAVITDAGTPAISDPGEDLVRIAHEKGVKVVPIPGPCAAISALCASGMPSERFVFEGFLPRSGKERKQRLEECASSNKTMIFYEAPHRFGKTLSDIFEIFGDRQIFIARELTKINEELSLTTLSEAVKTYAEKDVKGEIVFIISGAEKSNDQAFWQNMSVAQHVEFYVNNGLSNMDAVKQVAKDRGVSKNDIYKIVMVK